jgi:hypothetical protein
MCEDEVAALAIFILSHGEDNGTIFAADYPFRFGSTAGSGGLGTCLKLVLGVNSPSLTRFALVASIGLQGGP